MANRILVIDDEQVILDLTSMILRSKGYEVFTASGGQLGLEVADRENPELVLLDYMMPGMDGMTALKELRTRHPDSYVVMFTGKGSEEIAVELMKAGASDYILKPFNNQDLVDRIESVLRIRRVELANQELRRERERLLKEVEAWNRELEARVERKTRELEQAHDEILQAEKLAALGHMSAGMAHEIRNPLNTISLFAQVLKGSLGGDMEKLDSLDRILKEVDRIDGILINLLAASKRPRYELQPVVLTDIIDTALDSFKAQISAQSIDVHKAYDPDVPPLQADPAELESVFTNMFMNSLYEMPNGGTLRLALTHEQGQLNVTVSDTGRGIPEEHLNKIFDPFFTTKERGTGFGLSVVYRVIKTYGGRIAVKSRPEEGTCFHIELPLDHSAP